MDRTARRVQAERNRRRLPPRGRASRWGRRIAGLLATALFLGAGVATVLSILPGRDGQTPAVAATPTPAKHSAAKQVKPKPKPVRLTKAQVAARRAAVATLRLQGYTTIRARDYDPKATLRVLIGRPVGDAAGGLRAFFFVKNVFL